MENDDGLDALIWWFVNESRLPNVGFLAWKILGIQVHRLRLNGFSPLQVCSLICDCVVLGLRIS